MSFNSSRKAYSGSALWIAWGAMLAGAFLFLIFSIWKAATV